MNIYSDITNQLNYDRNYYKNIKYIKINETSKLLEIDKINLNKLFEYFEINNNTIYECYINKDTFNIHTYKFIYSNFWKNYKIKKVKKQKQK